MAKNFDLQISIVGIQHHVTISGRRGLSRQLPVRVKLRREADNEHDENAIKIVVAEGPYTGIHLGYVPRLVAAELAPKLDTKKLKVCLAQMEGLDVDRGTGDMYLKGHKR